MAKVKLAEFRAGQAALVWNPFHPVERPEVPVVRLTPRQSPGLSGSRGLNESRALSASLELSEDWIRNPIDAFVATEYARLGIKPRPPAPKEVLLRRVYLDLVGLPPTREELHAFLADSVARRLREGRRPAAGQPAVRRAVGPALDGRLAVQRLGRLRPAGPRQPAAHLALARLDHRVAQRRQGLRPHGPRDARRPTSCRRPIATPCARPAFWRNCTSFNRNVWLTDTVEHTSKAFLGITLNCAHCHDHMYDPLTQQEYYRFRAFFEPYHVRIDPLPGQPDPEKGGLARVYDADVEAKTYLFLRGDERTPDKSKPMVPGTPAFIGGGELKIEPVMLPVESFYPSLAPIVIDELLANAKSRVNRQRRA